jgi:hypothetical protein
MNRLLVKNVVLDSIFSSEDINVKDKSIVRMQPSLISDNGMAHMFNRERGPSYLIATQ